MYCAKYIIYLSLSDDYNRVVLEPDGDGYDEGDYINASYVDVSAIYHSHLRSLRSYTTQMASLNLTCKWEEDIKLSVRFIQDLSFLCQSLTQPKAYIVTQGPTETSIGDFWRMVWQERASCIVMVTRTFDFIRVSCAFRRIPLSSHLWTTP